MIRFYPPDASPGRDGTPIVDILDGAQFYTVTNIAIAHNIASATTNAINAAYIDDVTETGDTTETDDATETGDTTETNDATEADDAAAAAHARFRGRLRAVSRYRCQICHRWTGRTSATCTERTIWVSNASCYYCTWATSWSLATDESLDLRQTLVNVEEHVRSGQEEFQNEEDEAQARADFLLNRWLATQHNAERRMMAFVCDGRVGAPIFLWG
ncbi:hypothetical protein N0V84_009635 [Fusarium piperis]|uniref:Uncharacterized protein n=1 Tax=Fusarium piperis TaxID=1435070 RepID=A0A9W9BHV3_9HYPO|nr:hypothetical protein N0V84_009635 [Fusarium piperis]